jgi:WhiB family redox-sensing transcriptional regulator
MTTYDIQGPQASFTFLNQTWAVDAVCAQTDPELFHPDRGGSITAAKRVCAGCPATTQCLDWALATNQRWGIWGGLSTRERDHVRRAAA